ncbi:MAG: hypothetical protein KF897_03200 [Opitutaceae bacterium]|nr:hypothetical protein [Opitutaceae bacterium]
MPKKLPKAAEPVLLDLEQFVLHAAVEFEHHWFFAAHETVTRFDDVLSEWNFWWSSCSSVTWTATVVSLSKFYETNVHTVNVHHFMDLLASDPSQDWSEELYQMRAILASSEKIARDITLLRSNYHIHKNRKLTFEETYGKTSSKWNDLRDLIENSRLVLNVVVRAIDGNEIITSEPARIIREQLTEIVGQLHRNRTP